jgi:HK97 family phage major capsid protein
MVDRLLQERDSLERRVDSMKQVANEQDRLLNDDEKTAVQAAKDRVARLDEQLDLIGDTLAMSDESRSRLARVTRSVVATPPGYNRAGEVLYDILHASDGASATRLQAAMNRAAEHMGTEKTTTVATAGDLGGLVVTPVVGAVIDPYPSGMPFANALGLTESPSAMHFMRPRIVDTSFASGVGTQSLEKAELVSKAFEVTADPITLATVGGYLNVSQQLISLQPGSLDLIISHMLKRLAAKIDGMLITEMALSTGKVTLSLTADAAATLKAIYDASAAVYAATGELAQWIAMGPTGYARLGSLVDAAGRPLFPTIGPANAPGTASAAQFSSTVAGLRVVVTPGITDATFWVGNGDVLEGYLYRFPVLEAVEPSVLGRQVAVAAAAAAYRPIPNGAIHLAP